MRGIFISVNTSVKMLPAKTCNKRNILLLYFPIGLGVNPWIRTSDVKNYVQTYVGYINIQ